MKHVCKITVRTYECDMNNHVNNANYLNYLEYARHEYLKAVGFDYKASISMGYGLFVTRIEIDYKKPAVLDDELVIESEAVKKGAASGAMLQTIKNGQDTVVLAKVFWAFVDSNGKPCRIPAELDVDGLKPSV